MVTGCGVGSHVTDISATDAIDHQETVMAVTTAPHPAFPTVASGGYDPAVVDAAFEAERAWRRYLEERAALLLREAQALHGALAMPAVAAPTGLSAAVPAGRPAPGVADPTGAEDLKARQTAAKRKAAAEKRKATIAAKKAAAQAEAEAAAAKPQTPASVPAQADPSSSLSPGAAWARRTAGAALPTPARPAAKPRPAVAAVPAPTALSFPALGAVHPLPVDAVEQPKAKAKRSAPARKPAAAPAPSSAAAMFGPVATMGPILEPAAGRTESRVIRLV
ncbi:MAG: hypothetical protein ACT4QF_24765 [Sporichthyaceae bacterium]